MPMTLAHLQIRTTESLVPTLRSHPWTTLVPALQAFRPTLYPVFSNRLIAMEQQMRSDGGGTILPVHECWDLLKSVALGRLVTCVDGRPEIFPVNFVAQHRTV